MFSVFHPESKGDKNPKLSISEICQLNPESDYICKCAKKNHPY